LEGCGIGGQHAGVRARQILVFWDVNVSMHSTNGFWTELENGGDIDLWSLWDDGRTLSMEEDNG